jgi:hypothetical protein
MAAQGRATRATTLEQRTQVGDESVVTGHQLVQLSAAGNVLIFEQLRLAGLWGSQYRCGDLVVNRRELGANTRKET